MTTITETTGNTETNYYKTLNELYPDFSESDWNRALELGKKYNYSSEVVYNCALRLMLWPVSREYIVDEIEGAMVLANAACEE